MIDASTEARFALVISFLSLCLAAWSIKYARQQAINSTKALARKDPVIEMSLDEDDSFHALPGYGHVDILIRNQAPAAINVLGLRSASKDLQILKCGGVLPGEASLPLSMLSQQLSNSDRGERIALLVDPIEPNSSLKYRAYIKGNRSTQPLVLEWEWADGHQRGKP